MEQSIGNDDLSVRDTNIETFMNKNNTKSNKCNQCSYASSYASHLRRHLKTHSGEKSNKCNQCDFVSSRADHLRRHLKTHSGEESNKWNDTTVVWIVWEDIIAVSVYFSKLCKSAPFKRDKQDSDQGTQRWTRPFSM